MHHIKTRDCVLKLSFGHATRFHANGRTYDAGPFTADQAGVLFGSLAAQHDFVCHNGDGSRCPDGCDAPADPKRIAMLDQITEVPDLDAMTRERAVEGTTHE